MASHAGDDENVSRDGTDAVGDAFQLVAQGLAQLQEALRVQKQEAERKVQEALRLQEEAERRTKEALRLQEQRAATAWREMERKLQEKDDAIRALQQRLQDAQERIAAVEGRTTASGASAGQGGVQRLEDRVDKVEASLQRAIQTFVPRVEALLSQLEEPRSLATAASISAANACEAPEPPGEESSSLSSVAGHQGAAAGDKDHERQRLMSRVREAMSRIEKARTSPSPLGEQLCKAAEEGRLSDVRRLIDSGADVNYFDGLSSNALLRAVCSGNVDAVSLLLQRGADANAVNDCGNSALHWDVSEGRSGPCVDLLVGAGGDVDARNLEGETPLHYAAHFDSEQAVRALLAAGARKDLKVWCGEWKDKTPFDLAASRVVEDLLRAGPV